MNRAPRSYSWLLWKILLAALLSFGTNTAHADLALPEPFIEALAEAGLAFNEEAFEAFGIAPIAENPHMDYELAVRSKKIPLEIRFAIRRYDPSPKVEDVGPEMMQRAVFSPVLMNIAEWRGRGSERTPMIIKSSVYDENAVQAEFNANWGETGIVVPKKEFAGNFDRCMVVFIAKQRTQAFIFYLFNSKDTESAMAELEPVFYTLRFR